MRKFVATDRNSPFKYITAELIDPITIEVAVGQRVRNAGRDETKEAHLDVAGARQLAGFLTELADRADATAQRVASPS